MIDIKKTFDEGYSINDLRHLHSNARYCYEAIEDFIAIWEHREKSDDTVEMLEFIKNIKKKIVS